MNNFLPSNEIADFLLEECRERGEVLTNLKLQKLLYYTQAWYLALNDEPLFQEDFQAWIHGPVLPSQYRRFRDHKWHPIMTEVAKPDLPEKIVSHLSEILDVFGSESAVALELMTHKERPWLDARNGISSIEPSEALISKSAMLSFYKTFANA